MPLPLPLEPFEFYYLADERPGFPMIYPFELVFRGRLERTVFEEALRITLARHPLLTAQVENGRRGWPQWIATDPPLINWHWSGRREDLPDEPIDLWHGAGLHLWIHAEGDHTRLLLGFHHACSDGVGTLKFIADLFLAYDHLIARREGEPPWPAVDLERLRIRGDFGLGNYRVTTIDIINLLRTWIPLLFRPAAVVGSTGRAPSTRPMTPMTFDIRWLSIEETQRLRETARRLSVTVNDLVLREVFLFLAEWNAEQGGSKRPLRINLPTNLRLDADATMPATNVLSFAFPTRRLRDLKDPQRLLNGIRDQMADIKQWRLSLYFIGGLRIGCWFPSVVRGFLRRDWTFATAVFSNLGPILADVNLPRENGRLVTGGAVLQSIGMAPPVRPNTRAGIVIYTYAERLGICLRADPRWFTDAEQRDMLDRFSARLLATISADR